jgi:Domain of unknown function (DUF4296)
LNRVGFILLLFIAACSNRSEIPGDIIPPDSMRLIMKDIIIAGEYSDQFISKDSTRPNKKKANQELYEAIFKIHHTSREEVKKSLSFYESRPDLNKKIFDSLAADANRRRTELYLPKPIHKPGKLPVK